jgi:hypothetical protein
MSILPYSLDNWLTDGGEIANLAHCPVTLHRQKGSWYSFIVEAE